VPPAVAQDLEEQIRCAVEPFRRIMPVRRAGDVTFDTHELCQPAEATERGLYLGQHVQGGEPGSGVTLFLSKFRSNPTQITRLAILNGQLRRDEQQVFRADRRAVVAGRIWRRR